MSAPLQDSYRGDGWVVAIQSEQVRGEPRFYWPYVHLGDRAVDMYSTEWKAMGLPGVDHHYRGTKDQARRWARRIATHLVGESR